MSKPIKRLSKQKNILPLASGGQVTQPRHATEIEIKTVLDTVPQRRYNPLKYTPKQMQLLIDDYFATAPKPWLICGLLLHLDTSYDLLCDYANKPMFAEMIKKAKLRIVADSEQKAVEKNSIGAMFHAKSILRNIFGDKLQQEIAVSAVKQLIIE